MEVVSREKAPHYTWGENCDGWRLANHESLSVIEERMPPGSAEIPHYHRKARQFFFVLEGELTIERPGFAQRFGKFEGVDVLAGEPHHVRNCSESDAVFLVISSPRAQGDRVPFENGLPTQVETVITYVEMRSPGELRPKYADDPRFSIRAVTTPQWKFNRFLYGFVGEGWNWTDKNVWSDEQWRAYAESPDLQTFVAYFDGSIAGYFEIERQDGKEVEITYLGLAREFLGRGLGGALLTRAVEEGWQWKVDRVWLHTCTLDHSAALPNYLARGFKVYKTEKKSETLERF